MLRTRSVPSSRRLAMLAGMSFVALLGMMSASSRQAAAENWPQWRGPRGDGVSQETGLPTSWSSTDNVLWRLPLPGSGGATPIVWEDRVFVTSTKGDDLVLLCVSTDGKLLWERQVAGGNYQARGDEGNAASPSPSTDGTHVWVMFGTGDLACYDFEGNQVWHVDLQDRYGRFNIQFGLSSTPVLDGDRLYLQLLHSNDWLVLALDNLTGAEIWKHRRQSDAYNECEQSYASPVLYRDGERSFLLTHGCDYIVAHRLSDGAELWRCGGLNPRGNYNQTLRFVASPLAVPGMVVVPSAKRGPVLGLKPDSFGDITEKDEAYFWRRDADTPDVPSPLVVDGLLYLCREDGRLICADAETGEEHYYERTFSDRHRASPVAGDGKLYTTARRGVITVTKIGPTFEVLATNEMGEEMSASPVISNGRIYLRTFDALYAIGSKK